jgi:hypothetical protein
MPCRLRLGAHPERRARRAEGVWGWVGRQRGGPNATGSFSNGPPPNRTCKFPSIRLSSDGLSHECDLSPFRRLASRVPTCGPGPRRRLPPFALWPAFPVADYYGGSVARGVAPHGPIPCSRVRHVRARVRPPIPPYAPVHCRVSPARATVLPFHPAARPLRAAPVAGRHVSRCSRQSRPQPSHDGRDLSRSAGGAWWREFIFSDRGWGSSRVALAMPRGPGRAGLHRRRAAPLSRQAVVPLASSVTGKPGGPGHIARVPSFLRKGCRTHYHGALKR